MQDNTLYGAPIVLDNGSGTIKAGFAGQQYPKFVCPSYVGTLKHERVMAGGLEGDRFIGSRAREHRGLLRLSYPMEHGIVEDWDGMEKLWTEVFSKDGLGVQPDDHPLLLTEAPLNPYKNRERSAERLFESIGVPSLFISMQAVLALYASGRTTGAVLDIGDGVSHAVPIVEGFALKHAITRIDVAGRDVTRYLQLLLRREGYTFKTTAEFEEVRKIKETMCFVSKKPSHDETLEENKSEEHHLPDGQKISIGKAKFRAPEILFDPSLIGEEYAGVHRMLAHSIRKSDLDLRKPLYESIVLSGGSTMFQSFGERLLAEVKKEVVKDFKIRIYSPPDRIFSTWLGGSILASLETFKELWITKKDWQEHGASILHRKSFM